MKNILPALLLIAFVFADVYASNTVKITKITGSIQIARPDSGKKEVYKDINKVPEIMYGSTIFADGGTAEIGIFSATSIILEKNQEILVLKHPVTKAVEILKVESGEKKPKNSEIKIWLADYASATFGSDTKIAVFENYPSIILKVIRGSAVVKGAEGKTYELAAGEYYEAKQNITR